LPSSYEHAKHRIRLFKILEHVIIPDLRVKV
jgi:hypothetical protein